MIMMRSLLILLAACATVTTAYTNTTSRIITHIPFQIHNQDGDEHVFAHFGELPHRIGSIAAFVYHSGDFLCNPVQNVTSHEWHHPFILMTDRGPSVDPCTMVAKARHAQQAGASALIVADRKCRCTDKDCTDTYMDKCESEKETPVLVNDGSAGDISIPSVLLFKVQAEKIKERLKNHEPVLVEITWGLKQEIEDDNSHLWYHLWTTAHDPLMDYETYKNLRTITHAFDGHVGFTPRLGVIDGHRYDCPSTPSDDGPCDHLCTNGGRYCALHHKNLSGKPIVVETIRRLCIWKWYGTDEHHKASTIWWDYVLYHMEHCSDPHKYSDEACLKDALKHAKIDEKTIDQCMESSGDVESDSENAFLEDMLEKHSRSGVVALPALTVNRDVLDHTNSFALFETICSHFWMNDFEKTPEICVQCATCPNIIGCLENKGHCVGFSMHHGSKKSGGGGHGWSVFFWMTAILMIGGGGYYYYKTRMEGGGFGGQGGGLLNDYLQLNESG